MREHEWHSNGPGKGDRPRPGDEKTFRENFEKVFAVKRETISNNGARRPARSKKKYT